MRTVVRGDKVVSIPPTYTSDVVGDGNPGDNIDWLLIYIIKDIVADKSRYNLLKAYVEGDPPKPEVPGAVDDSWAEFEAFRQKSRTNFAELVVGATLDRTIITGFRTAAGGDEEGDLEAEKIWDENDMDKQSDQVNSDMFTYGAGYLIANPITGRGKVYRPWQARVIEDVVGDPYAAVCLEHSPHEGRDYAYLWLRELDDNGMAKGKLFCHIAVRDRKNRGTVRERSFDTEVPLGTYTQQKWTWWKTVTDFPIDEVPLYEFENREGVGEFERHLDVLDRINHMLLQRVVIATMQAFKQRALKGNFPKYDTAGELIDYNKQFPADPAALWLLPAEAEVWESAQSSIQDMLAAVKDDVRDLASVTRTPISYFSPDSANQSAAGANKQGENYESKIDDRKARAGAKWRRWLSAMFKIKGGEDADKRAELDKIEIIWVSTEATTKTERYAAASAAAGTGLSLKTIMREVLEYNPRQMRLAEIERISQTLKAAIGAPVQNGQTPLQQQSAASASLAASNGSTSRSTGASSPTGGSQ